MFRSLVTVLKIVEGRISNSSLGILWEVCSVSGVSDRISKIPVNRVCLYSPVKKRSTSIKNFFTYIYSESNRISFFFECKKENFTLCLIYQGVKEGFIISIQSKMYQKNHISAISQMV